MLQKVIVPLTIQNIFKTIGIAFVLALYFKLLSCRFIQKQEQTNNKPLLFVSSNQNASRDQKSKITTGCRMRASEPDCRICSIYDKVGYTSRTPVPRDCRYKKACYLIFIIESRRNKMFYLQHFVSIL